MYTEKDYIDKLYSEKFGNYSTQAFKQEWNKLNAKLDRFNFLKFSFVTFNIFYLVVMFSFAGTVTYLGINNAILTKKIQILENKVVLRDKQSDKTIPLNIDSIILPKPDSISEIKKKVCLASELKKTERPMITDNTLKNDTVIAPQLIIKTDSNYVQVDSVLNTNPECRNIKKVKKTTFVKNTNILINDTVVIKRKVK